MKGVYTVKQVNEYVKNMFEQDFMLKRIGIKGEVSNCTYHSSGHIYFSLKDESGTISCVMFAGARSGLSFRMQLGDQVVVLGSVSVYPRDGRYQIYAKEVIKEGAGELHEKFEALKAELEEMGMFDSSYKQSIPAYVKTIGVVTAPTGAAVHDIIQVVERRNPFIQVVLYPALVQGDGAAKSVANGIRTLEEKVKPDVIIVGRGGGSLEDLWAFNEKEVAEAIFHCNIPIISAVGHETDTTIADFVADMRAATPSVAAEIATYEYLVTKHKIDEYNQKLDKIINLKIQDKRNFLEQVKRNLGYLHPSNKLKEQQHYLIEIERKLEVAIKHKLKDEKSKLVEMEDILVRKMESKLEHAKHNLLLAMTRLEGLSPLEKLKQGYAYVADEDGNNITEIKNVKKGKNLSIAVTDGYIEAEVTGLRKGKHSGK